MQSALYGWHTSGITWQYMQVLHLPGWDLLRSLSTRKMMPSVPTASLAVVHTGSSWAGLRQQPLLQHHLHRHSTEACKQSSHPWMLPAGELPRW